MPMKGLHFKKTVEVNGFRRLDMESYAVYPRELALIEGSLRTSSTIQFLSSKILEDTNNLILSEISTTDKWIQSTRDFLNSLEAHKIELAAASNTLNLAVEQFLQPFPPLPLDLAQSIIDFACFEDRNTTMTVSLVSKQMRQWSDDHLWRDITFHYNQTQQANRLVETLTYPNFLASAQAKHIQTLAFPVMPANSKKIFALPNLRTLVISASGSLPPLEGVSCPSIQHLSCVLEPSFYGSDPPVFPSLTHLNVLSPLDWKSRWWEGDWSGFRNLSSLTHLNLDLSTLPQGDCLTFLKSLTVSLPNSLQVAIVCFRGGQKDPIFDTVRMGRMDTRMVVSRKMTRYDGWYMRTTWVLYIEEDDLYFTKWASKGFQGRNNLWTRAMDILKERNASKVV
ncbi:hypothetical protein DL96DRAFT_1584817, partial [Flagelloscypha sp. PMI_526]